MGPVVADLVERHWLSGMGHHATCDGRSPGKSVMAEPSSVGAVRSIAALISASSFSLVPLRALSSAFCT